jgi:hypothetical protein
MSNPPGTGWTATEVIMAMLALTSPKVVPLGWPPEVNWINGPLPVVSTASIEPSGCTATLVTAPVTPEADHSEAGATSLLSMAEELPSAAVATAWIR